MTNLSKNHINKKPALDARHLYMTSQDTAGKIANSELT